ncbi:hypothetical protein AB0I10_24930 [Streptomyces sp. NPDC050636]|uniref:hypothetical protein n=1 Tax=Streptomyces sp. NPDC050636 TaxID=3154510 RepID=UPI00343EE025
MLTGYDADLIVLAADPVRDISVLADPDRVTHVWQRGELVKSSASGPAGTPPHRT